MTKDLEETLKELGPEYREVVDRLVSSRDAAPTRSARDSRARLPKVPCLLAASLLVALGLGVVFLRAPVPCARSGSVRVYTAAYAADADSLRQIVAAQRSDGSWANDFLTRQNAAALARATDPASHVAYKKAVRYLRTKGLAPLSEEELRLRGRLAATRS